MPRQGRQSGAIRTLRLLKLIPYLYPEERDPIARLALLFQVSPRQIARDLALLRKEGFEVPRWPMSLNPQGSNRKRLTQIDLPLETDMETLATIHATQASAQATLAAPQTPPAPAPELV